MRRLLRSILVSGLLVAQPALAAVPNDPLIEQQWYLGKVKAFDAWDQATGNPEVVVAVLDTGVDLDHADIAGNLWTNPGEVALDGIDNDGNGFADDLHGWDFVDRDAIAEPDPVAGDEQDAIIHGTAIAGVIGAIGNNGEGVAEIAWRVRLMSVRILDNGGSGNSGDATEALRYAVKNGADVINVSFAGFEVDETFRAAVRDAYEAGVVIVAAVGNRSNGGADLDVNPLYPGCFVAGGGGGWGVGGRGRHHGAGHEGVVLQLRRVLYRYRGTWHRHLLGRVSGRGRGRVPRAVPRRMERHVHRRPDCRRHGGASQGGVPEPVAVGHEDRPAAVGGPREDRGPSHGGAWRRTRERGGGVRGGEGAVAGQGPCHGAAGRAKAHAFLELGSRSRGHRGGQRPQTAGGGV